MRIRSYATKESMFANVAKIGLVLEQLGDNKWNVLDRGMIVGSAGFYAGRWEINTLDEDCGL